MIAKDQLRSFVERIERLEEDKAEIANDIREVYAEAKSSGYDCKAIRALVKMRKQDADERREQEAILETYMHALGMLSDMPLGQAAIERSRKRTKESMADLSALAKDGNRVAMGFNVAIPKT